MSMVTQCPSCGTLFRVSEQQLQAHHGQVRCGRCMTVFDGLKALTTAPEPGASRLQPAAGESAATDEAPGSGVAVVAPQSPAAAPRAAEPDYGAVPEQLSLEDELFLREARERARHRARLWGAASAVALFVLAGQAVYLFRTELATHVPGVKRPLVRLCELFQCSVPLPQRPKLIAIEASDLHIVDPARPGIIQLTATLRNHAGYDLAYPALDLVLTNSREHTIARRIFLPAEYLERGRDVTAGISANAEVTVRVDLDTGGMNAAGFRLDLLPAPAP